MKVLRSLTLPFTTLALAAVAVANVTILAGPAAGAYPDIQSAVNAAFDGDILVVSAGTYPGFVVDDKAVRIFAVNGAIVSITGTIEVRNLASAKTLVLSGVTSQIPNGGSQLAGLRLTNDSGYVRIQDCILGGMSASSSGASCIGHDGGTGASVSNCIHVTFAHCIVRGGSGQSLSCFGGGSYGGNGGDATFVEYSAVAAHSCQFRGGNAGSGDFVGGSGGAGARINAELFAAGCSFSGGNGGDALADGYGYGGFGGDGLRAIAPTSRLLDNTYQGGWFGYGDASSGGPGQPMSGGSALVLLQGSARKMQCARTTLDSQTVTVTVTGQPGDVAYIAVHRRPSWLWNSAWSGVWLLPMVSTSSKQLLGTIPASGTLVAQYQPRPCGPNQVARVDYLQLAVIDSSGQRFIAEPATLLVIDG